MLFYKPSVVGGYQLRIINVKVTMFVSLFVGVFDTQKLMYVFKSNNNNMKIFETLVSEKKN